MIQFRILVGVFSLFIVVGVKQPLYGWRDIVVFKAFVNLVGLAVLQAFYIYLVTT